MPKDSQGRPFDLLQNPMTLPTRLNPAQVFEMQLAKIARKTGKHVLMPAFFKGSLVDHVSNELRKHGLSDTEDILDPGTNKKIKKVLTGEMFIMKLQHTAESKIGARDVGGYTAEGLPSGGGKEGSKTIATLGLNALLSHGATNVIRDLKQVRGQKNDDYWRAFKLGYTPPTPPISTAYKKFQAYLQGAGVNIKKVGDQEQLFALTDADTDKLSSGEVTNPNTVNMKDMQPIDGGLFDRGITGGHGGCLHYSTQILTDQGMLQIGDIVTNKTVVNVLSYDFSSRDFVWKPVVNWFKNKVGGLRKFCFESQARLSDRFYRFTTSTLWATPTHGVYDLHGEKKNIIDASYLLAATEELSYTQRQILLGGILGDSTISKHGNLIMKHGLKQREYLSWKAGAFSSLSDSCGIHEHTVESFGVRRTGVMFRTRAHAAFYKERARFYGPGKKRITDETLKEIDELGLAVWYFDDGSVTRRLDKNTLYVTFCTDGFDYESVQLLSDWLHLRWGLTNCIYRSESAYADKDFGWEIKLCGEPAETLLDIVSPYAVNCMQYKLGRRPNTAQCIKCDKEVQRRQKICIDCLLVEARACGTGKLPKHIRRRLGGTARVREILAGIAALPPNIPTDILRWNRRMVIAGLRTAAVSADTATHMVAEPILFESAPETGQCWESCKVAYDIEVADTHNYIANGIVVSNSKWGHITFPEPIPNPVMEDPIRRLLNLTKAQLNDVIAGKKDINGRTGGAAIKEALSRINVAQSMDVAKEEVRGKTGSARDSAIKRMRLLAMLKDTGLKPQDMVITRLPVVPPNYRPISQLKPGMSVSSDANFLYQDLLHAKDAYSEVTKEFGKATDVERLNLYNAAKAVTGLGDPIGQKTQDSGIGGLLQHVFGKTSPKFGLYQRRIIGTKADVSGRGVITPNPAMDMDQVGLPEDHAWKSYKPFVIRRLVRRGMPAVTAADLVEQRDPRAKVELLAEMEHRPILITRAPVLHRYGIMAAMPVLVAGKTLQVSPSITAPFTADFDGDAQLNYILTSLDKDSESAIISSRGKTFLEDRKMAARFEVTVPVCKDGNLYMFDLEDFPHGSLLKENGGSKNNIDFYEVMPGTAALGMDPASGQLKWFPVSMWSVHREHEIEIVDLASGRQIITDDDPRAVFGTGTDSMKLLRETPTVALDKGMLVPVSVAMPAFDTAITEIALHNLTTTTSAHRLTKNLQLTRDVGYVLGVMTGDGWASNPSHNGEFSATQFHICGNDEDVFSAFNTGVQNFFEDGEIIAGRVVQKKEDGNRYGSVTRLTYSSTSLAVYFKDLLDHGAQNKHLPPWFMQTSRDFRLGLFGGLMDTDGSISISNAKAKKKPQLLVSFTSTSLRLVREVKILAASLNIKSKITGFTYRGDRQGWIINFSTIDAFKWHGEGMHCARKISKFNEAPEPNADAGVTARHDLVPFPKTISTIVRAKMLQLDYCKVTADKDQKALYQYMSRGCDAGYVTRQFAKQATVLGLHLGSEDAEAWASCVKDEAVTWDPVVNVVKTGKVEVGYDLTVPGSETFMAIDGVILSNTMSYHVPVSEDARVEALDKMLPSKNLKSIATFDVHYGPRHEYVYGLYQASKKRNKGEVKRFATQKDALNAYRRGEVDVGDEVVVGK